jgi:hypothetical protein
MTRLTVIVPILFALSGFQNVKLVKTKVAEGITVEIPSSFISMTEAEINTKYISTKPPVALYTDQSRLVDFGVNVAFSRWRPEDIEMMKSFYKSNIMGLYDDVQFIKETTTEINGRTFAVFEFLSTVRDDNGSPLENKSVSQYTYIQYTIINYKTVLFNFSCPIRMRDQWQSVAAQIMESVKIEKNL